RPVRLDADRDELHRARSGVDRRVRSFFRYEPGEAGVARLTRAHLPDGHVALAGRQLNDDRGGRMRVDRFTGTRFHPEMRDERRPVVEHLISRDSGWRLLSVS